MNIISKIWKNRRFLRYLHQSIYFNFHYLPFKQAVKLPILVYKLHIVEGKGKVVIDAPVIKTGMIQLGFNVVSVYPRTGITWDNHGGKVIFEKRCEIGNDSYVSFGKNTEVRFGNDFRASAGLKLVSFRGIKFGDFVRFGWGCLIMDTNFHPLFDMKNKRFKKASSPIEIGDYNWFGTQCKVMHGTHTPERCVFGMETIVTRNSEMESFCVMGGSPVKILSRDIMRIIGQDVEPE